MNKKKKFFLLLPFLFFYLTVLSQHPEGITGVWLKQSTEGKIEIFKVYDMLFGNLIWLKNPINESGKLKLDTKNPDASKTNRKLQGLLILTGFRWDQANKHWNDGEIYDPKSGKTYKCSLTLQNKDELYIRGYIGNSLLGRTDTWTWVKEEQLASHQRILLNNRDIP